MAVVAGGELHDDGYVDMQIGTEKLPWEMHTWRVRWLWLCMDMQIGNASIVEKNTAKSKGHGYMNESASHVHIHEHSKAKIRRCT